MTPADEQGQNGTNGINNGTTGGTMGGGMEPSTPAMGASSSTADPLAGGNDIGFGTTGQSSAQGGGMSASGGSMGGSTDDGQGRFSGVRDQAMKLRSQATDRARTAAEDSKTRATEKLDGLAQAVHQAAGNLEDQIGPQFAQYAHRAADALDSFSASLRNKSVDELVEEATQFARRSPAVAIGAAVAVGFALSRFLKATSSASAGTSRNAYALDDDDDMPSMSGGRTGADTQPRYNA